MKRLKKILIIALMLLSVIVLNTCVYMFWGQAMSTRKLDSGKRLSIYECCSIYTMHIAMALIELPHYPESAKQILRAHTHFGDNVFCGPTETASLKMLTVKTTLALLELKDKPMGTRVKCSWDTKDDLQLSHKEYRASLALNPCFAERTDAYGSEDICYALTAIIQYPDRRMLTFENRFAELTFNLGLYRYLQEIGWLGKYQMHYLYFEELIDDAAEILLNPALD